MSNIGGFDLDGDDKIRLSIAEIQADREKTLEDAGLVQDLIAESPLAKHQLQEKLDQFDIVEADLKSMLSNPEEP